MEMVYRGVRYQSHPTLVYRGISVATGKQIRFLGRTCEQKKVVLRPVGV